MKPDELVAGRFEIKAFVGEGGMGAVYRALDRQTGEAVALKKIHASREGEARFVREARALALLSHPGIVRYVAHGTTQNGELYLAMEWLEGHTLRQRLALGPLGIDESVDLARRVAGALAHAHAQGIVHRDLNPANLLLVEGRVESVKILDFGLARHRVDLTQSSTHWEGPVGTLGYMAPEQARGTGEVDARADLFSLACVLFECLTGTPTFGADNYLAVLAKIVVASAPRVKELRPEVPSALDALVDRLLAKDPDDRLPDAEHVIEVLTGLGGSKPSLRTSSTHATPQLGASERQLVSVVVVAGAQGSTKNAEQRLARAAEAGRSFGLRAELLADGALVLTCVGSGAATDQAARAARCALSLRAQSVESNAAIALATGWAHVGGERELGAVLERAARLLDDKGAKVVRIDDATAGLLSSRFSISGDTSSLLLVDEREDARPVRLLLGKNTPCVGRERELRTLAAIVDDCLRGPTAQAVLLTGPAGVGKSRIRYELLRGIGGRHDQMEVWVGRGDPMRAGSPFGILGLALREAAGISEGEPLDVQHRKLRARVSRHVASENQVRVSEFLGELLGLPVTGELGVQLKAARADALLMSDQIQKAWEDFVSAECEAHPLLLVLEDFQWGDAATVKLIDSTLRNLPETPLAVVAVARPDVHELFPAMWSERNVHEVRVGALTRRAAEALVRDMLGADFPSDEVGDIVQRAGGNAFYLEELIRAHAEGRGSELPDTVLAMVQGRIEAMEAEARRVLRAASVFGQTFWPGAVAALLGGTSMLNEVREWLDTLDQREVVTRRNESKFPSEREYAFRHALVRDAAYAMLTEDDRVLGHRLAASWLERIGTRDSVLLAENFERGGMQENAVEWWLAAAHDALDASDFDAAIARSERGLALGAKTRAPALELTRGEALRVKGDVALAAESIERALSAFPSGSLGFCNAAGELALVLQRLGRAKDLTDAAVRLADITAAGDVADALALARVRTALALLRVGERAEAKKLMALVERGRSLPGPVTRAFIHAFFAIEALLDNNPSHYLAEARTALAYHEEVGDTRLALEQSINIGSVYLELGAYEEAERLLRDGLAKAERLNLHHAVAGAKHNLGLVLAHLGRFEDALGLEQEALDSLRGKDRRLEGGALLSMAVIHELAGELGSAEEEAREALALLRETAPPLVPRALGTLASICLLSVNLEGARDAADEAAQLLEAGGVESGENLIRRVQIEAVAASGDRDRARALLATAWDRLSAQAGRLSGEELRQSFLTRVPDNARIVALREAWKD